MFKLIAGTMTLALCLGTAGLLATNGKPNQNVDAQLAADGAFRDGLYLGRLAAESGRPPRPMTGRWSTKQDRASFVAGYRRTYNYVVAVATPNGQSRNE